jgi:glycosyltransferase involved in cell wall biosynthesis
MNKEISMKIKISIIYPADPMGSKVGGAETFIKGFIKYAPEYFDIEYIGITGDPKCAAGKWAAARLGNKNFRILPLLYEKDENRKTIIPLALRFVLKLKYSKIDFCNRIILFNRIEPAFLFRKTALPKILVVHNDIEKQIMGSGSEVLWSKFPWLYFTFEKSIFKTLNKIYTVSENTMKFYIAKYAGQAGKYSFIPTWVDTDIFHPVEESKISIRDRLRSLNKALPQNAKWVLFAGRLQKQKAPFRLIDSFLEYYKKNKYSCFIMIGEGNLRKETQLYVSTSGIENSVFFMGSLEQKVIADFYRASDVFLLASDYEGMPISVLEALGSGLPVVSTNAGEVKRVVKNNYSGEVVDNLSKEAISGALNKVLNNGNIYSKENCVESISSYTPQKVLYPLYESIKNLYKGKKPAAEV